MAQIVPNLAAGSDSMVRYPALKAILFPTLVEYHSVSMKRYGQELTQALTNLSAPDWQFESIECHQVELVAKLFPGRKGKVAAERLGRLVRYPLVARQHRGDAHHIFDHSHAHLLGSLPAEKTVITCHDIIPFLALKGVIDMPVAKNVARAFPKIIANLERAGKIITDSDSTKNDLLTHTKVSAERIQTVHAGLNPVFSPTPPMGQSPNEERERVRALYHFPPDALVLLHVGTTGRYKNTPALIRLLRALRHEPALEDRVWLLRVGVPFEPEVEALIDSLGIRERLVQAGNVPGDQALAAHYRAADLFVFPSLWEGFGWPPLESMACGTPAVTSNTASLPEVVGPKGVTVSPNDDDALAATVSALLQNPARLSELRESGLAWAAHFTWKRAAEQALAVYKELAR